MPTPTLLLLAALFRGGAAFAIGWPATVLSSRGSEVVRMAALPESERVAAVLLAGGSGKRMGAKDSSGKAMPKQFLELQGKSVLQLSLELLQKVDNLDLLVIVLAPEFRELDFLAAASATDSRIVFADPGAERQNSVENGLAKVGTDCTLVAVHDAARPLVTLDEIHRCLADAAEHGAAVREPCDASPASPGPLCTLSTLGAGISVPRAASPTASNLPLSP
eukprot:scaffold9162_cov108-Isochrysis_galbana.AAC.4